ncbi:1,2-phenylacetyl-CoA epoxidase subunit PaaE [Prauserella muralis]|uniref:Phenylacetic acid degradation protein n=1 Tax=Prauserella muralis TaxID=588067 RepID=A0A2V4B6P8_9PSEU|nr:1,2-phenylacetyl-CoA epoxidase subunit PaaE [Prauserella muralis]PXY31065.1 phenylacetic acid degradation protein [Prauserella muralis]TWE14655.1 ring-1,2-phenylacetyl-CoA epoxidase subunit PaaE [Prauserella muralis]
MTAAAPARARTTFHQLTVADVTRLCDDAVAVTFDVPPELADEYRFRPGQSLTLRRTIDGREERRSYSICAPAGAAPRVGVREVPDGLFSTWLVRDVRPGDRIEVGTPTGTFTPDLDEPGHHVLVAAGSGITPVLSIAASLLRNPATKVTLFYGNRRTDTVMFADELADLKDRYPARFELVHVLSREPREVELFTGRLDAEKLTDLLRLLPQPVQVDHWWLCGPYGMVTDAQDVLARHDVQPRRVHQELFFVDDVPPEPVRHAEAVLTGETSEITVKLDGRLTTVLISQDTAVLDGAQRARPDLPFACKGGVCGTCRAKVTDGEVHMRRNFALEADEVEKGFVLTCQSRPLTEKVTVDYDV